MKRFLSVGLLLVVLVLCLLWASKVVVAEEPDKIFWTLRRLVDRAPLNEYGNKSLQAVKVVAGDTVQFAIIYVPPGREKPEQIMAVRYNERTGELMGVGYFYEDKQYFEPIRTPFGFMASPIEKEEAVRRAAEFLTDFKQLKINI